MVDYDVDCVRRYSFHFVPHPVFVHARGLGVRVRGTSIRVGSTSEGRGVFGDVARASM